MKNRISYSPSRLATQLSDAIPGVVKYAGPLGLAAGMATALTASQTALELAINDHEQGKLDARNSGNAVDVVMKTCRTFVTVVRELSKPTVGGKYSQLWDAFGFNGSLVIPKTVDGMWELMGKLSGHLAENPALANTELNLNTAQATALRGQLLAAKTLLNEKKGDRQRLIEARDVQVAAARVLMRELAGALRVKLTPLDSRWVEFGFNKPGAKPTPDMPIGVTAVLMGANAISMKWPPVARAQHYRAWKRVIGVDTEMVFVRNTADLDFLMEQLPANSQVEVALSAANNGGESAKSAVVVVQTN